MDIQFYLQTAVQEVIQVGLVIADASDGCILYANRKASEFFGYSREDFKSMTFPDLLFDGEDPDIWKRETDSNVVKFKTRNASIFWGLMSSRPVSAKKGNDQGIFYSISDITRRKTAEDRLKKSQKKLHILSRALLNAQETERKRIAVELHDGISSNLTAVRLMLEQKIAEADCPDHGLETIVDKLRTISSDTRRISRNLHPSVLEDLGLVAGFRSVIREFNNIKPDLVINPDISIDEKKIAHGIKLTLYRILQESMNNIIKHSQADTVDIGCTFTDGHLWLTIHDNGCGFNVDEVINGEYDELKGIGLASIQQRAEYCNGSFHIESSPVNGTRITVKIPS